MYSRIRAENGPGNAVKHAYDLGGGICTVYSLKTKYHTLLQNYLQNILL
jgi:hypothetical protein